MLSIVIPVIRPSGRDRCIESIHQNAGIPDFLYEIVTDEDVNRIGCNLMIKKLVYKTHFDLVMFLADDVTIEPDCIAEAIKVMYSFTDTVGTLDPWGMVGLNDQYNDPNILATHWMCHKRLLDYLGGEFMHTGYRHCFSDVELIERCKLINRYKPAYKSVINHHHPAMDKTMDLDKDYLRVYSPPNFLHDKMLFKKRQKEGFR